MYDRHKAKEKELKLCAFVSNKQTNTNDPPVPLLSV